MPILPLPLSPPLDTTTRASWEAWTAAPPLLPRLPAAAFWEAMPPLTVPQFQALRLGRPTDRVAFQTMRSCFERFLDGDRRGSMEFLPLRRYSTIWARSHRTYLFRLDPSRTRRGARRPAADSVLGRILSWATPDDELESRFVMAALPSRVSRPDRTDRALLLLRRGVESGFVVDLRPATVPAYVWRPGAKGVERLGVRHVPRWKRTALDHGALAVEAAICRAEMWHSVAAIRAIRSEADLVSMARTGRPRAPKGGFRTVRPAGQRNEPAVADVAVETVGGGRFSIEVLSDNYRGGDLRAKYEALPAAVEFVATSRSVAGRAAREMPRTTVYHF